MDKQTKCAVCDMTWATWERTEKPCDFVEHDWEGDCD